MITPYIRILFAGLLLLVSPVQAVGQSEKRLDSIQEQLAWIEETKQWFYVIDGNTTFNASKEKSLEYLMEQLKQAFLSPDDEETKSLFSRLNNDTQYHEYVMALEARSMLKKIDFFIASWPIENVREEAEKYASSVKSGNFDGVSPYSYQGFGFLNDVLELRASYQKSLSTIYDAVVTLSERNSDAALAAMDQSIYAASLRKIFAPSQLDELARKYITYLHCELTDNKVGEHGYGVCGW